MPRYNGGFLGTDGLDAPDAPSSITPTVGVGSVSIAFTDEGGGTSATTSFVAQVSTNDTDYSAGSNTGSSSPIEITGLTGGTAHTAKVWAINAYGTSAPSSASASFTPASGRAVFAGGDVSGQRNDIRYFTLASTGNTTDFGDLTAVRSHIQDSGASSTRGIFAGGRDS
jgi:hypothetical protein